MKNLIAAVLMSLPSASVLALELRSGITAPTIIELYTSEACSSCPPADAWLSSLKNDPQLFRQFIPMAFHVDYWNQLGWTDRFSAVSYSQRQRAMQEFGALSQVYTPGFVVNNREWRAWFERGADTPFLVALHTAEPVGELALSWPKGEEIAIEFQPVMSSDNGLWVNIAVVGMGLTTSIKRGENRGRELHHDFVVLSLQRHKLVVKNGVANIALGGPVIPEQGQRGNALVVWISEGDSPAIRQAVASYF